MNPKPDSGGIAATLSPEQAARQPRFTYSTGDRPLDGYTIKRGIGSGGFGEVYYATSDGGKEVALKLVQRNLDIELRGVGQCLNLKHPNLVVLYDVKQSDAGDNWVVMEYVTGESLAELIGRQPIGMAPDQAVAYLRGICAGVGYLHEQGIVHRDLKPHNIFVENGVVKIGDYGLAKFISASRRSGQTESVGTVHYMAPELSRGRYGKEIDLYAIGVILFEMLTGRVPFAGESPGEVLMKHLTAEPDVSVLVEPYRSVVARLLAKDPADRYATAAEVLADLDARSAGYVPSGSPAGEARASAPPPIPPRAANQRARGAARRLMRSRDDRVIKGVCAGIAEHLEVDPVWVRLAAVLFGLGTGILPLVACYVILTLILPERYDETADGSPDRTSRIVRLPSQGVWAGVCAGIAANLAIDLVFVRLATVVLTIATGILPGLVLYFLLTVIMPTGESVQRSVSPTGPRPFRHFGKLCLRLMLAIVFGGGLGALVAAAVQAFVVRSTAFSNIVPLLGVGGGLVASGLLAYVLCRRLDRPHGLWPGFASLQIGAGAGMISAAWLMTAGQFGAGPAAAAGCGAGAIVAATAAFVLFTALGRPLAWRWFFVTVFIGVGVGLVVAGVGLELGITDGVTALVAVGAGLLMTVALACWLIFGNLARRLNPIARLEPARESDIAVAMTSGSRPTPTAARAQAVGEGLVVIVVLVVSALLLARGAAGLVAGRDEHRNLRFPVRVAPPLVVESELHRFRGHNGTVNTVAFNHDGTRLASGGADGTVRLWDMKTRGELRKLTGHTTGINGVAFSPDGTRLAAAARGNDVRVWDTETGTEVCRSIEHPGVVHVVAFGADGSQFATGSTDDVVRLIDAGTGKEVRQFFGCRADIHAVAFTADGRRLAAAGQYDVALRVWDVESGRQMQSIAAAPSWFTHIAISPDGATIATAGQSSGVSLWEMSTGRNLHNVPTETSMIKSVEFGPDPTQLVVAHWQGVQLWNERLRRTVCRFSSSQPGSLSFAAATISPDGAFIASGHDDGTIRLWEVPEAVRASTKGETTPQRASIEQL
jgi:WD40 repeat protein/phage shock protein PspC (stress-responsive transcriptional regulator)